MRVPDTIKNEGLELQHIHIGGVAASKDPIVVRTVLGSCIAVCLRDPVLEIGGMNHFMLPSASGSELKSTSFGIHAMEILINRCMSLGADRSRLEAKVFGGGHVLQFHRTEDSVSKINIRFAREFLRNEDIPVISHDVGGFAARELYFFTHSGRVLMKRLPATGLDPSDSADLQSEISTIATASNDDDNVTLFG